MVHGGLPRFAVSLSRLREVDRTIEIPRTKDIVTLDEELMSHLLWSDPRDLGEKKTAESKRGCGVYFGEEVRNGASRDIDCQ